MVYTEHAETVAVSRVTSLASVVCTSLRWIFKNAYEKLVTHLESRARAVSLLDSGE